MSAESVEEKTRGDWTLKDWPSDGPVDDVCEAVYHRSEGKRSWYCTRRDGHDGPHAAGTNSHVKATWVSS